MSRSAKAAFYFFTGPLMRVNGWIYRVFRAPRKGMVKVHLGPGQQNYIRGWINIDANMFTAECDVWADLRNKLPFADQTVDVFYSHHVVEHLPDLRMHCREMYRCLKPGGLFRVAGPNGDSAIKKFQENDLEWFGDYPDKRRSIGGRFENFIFSRQEHLTILTFSYLQELLAEAGFISIQLCQPKVETHSPEVIDRTLLNPEWESTPAFPHTLVVEGRKPETTS